MFATLEKFDPVTAAAVVARAAVSIEEEENPIVGEQLPEEVSLRQALLSEVRKALGVRSDDSSREAMDRMAEALDAETDRLLGPADETGALERLAVSGDLPSDLYHVNVIQHLAQFHGKHFLAEEQRIRQTVKCPDHELHYGPSMDGDQPALVSLFSKSFESKFPYRSFTLLVVGQRRGMQLDVHQAWRIYRDIISLDGAESLVDVLRRFSDHYGAEIEVGGKKGKLITTADIDNDEPIPTKFELKPHTEGKRKGKPRTVTVTTFIQKNPIGGARQAVFSVGIDLDMYRETLEQRGW